jgi:hypothetical protein
LPTILWNGQVVYLKIDCLGVHVYA